MRYSVIDELLASTPTFRTVLPPIKFFEPKKSFIELIDNMAKQKIVFDVGAGVGQVSKQLSEIGLKVIALDLIPRENQEYHVLITNSLIFTYPKNSLLLFCRPCHNGFVEGTIRQGLRCGVADFIYVSLAKNVDTDLGGFRKHFKCISKNVGQSGETMYRWSC